MRSIVITISALSLLLTGCGLSHTNEGSAAPTHTTIPAPNREYGGTRIAWSFMTSDARQAVRAVVARLGDTHPTVVLVLKTYADSPPHPLMYVVTLNGHFRYRSIQFHGLRFSVLGNGTKAWAFASQGHVLEGVPVTMTFRPAH